MEAHTGCVLQGDPGLGHSYDRLRKHLFVSLSLSFCDLFFFFSFLLRRSIRIALVGRGNSYLEICAFGHEADAQTAEITLDGRLGVRIRAHGHEKTPYRDVWDALGEEGDGDQDRLEDGEPVPLIVWPGDGIVVACYSNKFPEYCICVLVVSKEAASRARSLCSRMASEGQRD